MPELKLTDCPAMPIGFEDHQGQTLRDFSAAVSPASLLLAMKKGCWELDATAKAALFPPQATITRPSKHFVK